MDNVFIPLFTRARVERFKFSANYFLAVERRFGQDQAPLPWKTLYFSETGHHGRRVRWEKPRMHTRTDPHATRPVVLAGAKLGDTRSWNEFHRLYFPFACSIALRAGIPHADAEDLAAETMGKLIGKLHDFILYPSRGKFRTWLGTIVRNQIRDYFREQGRKPLHSTIGPTEDLEGERRTSTAERIPDTNTPAFGEFCDHEWSKYLLDKAMLEVKQTGNPEWFQAYDCVVIQGKSSPVAGKLLGIPAGTVRTNVRRFRNALNRAAKILERQIIRDARETRPR